MAGDCLPSSKCVNPRQTADWPLKPRLDANLLGVAGASLRFADTNLVRRLANTWALAALKGLHRCGAGASSAFLHTSTVQENSKTCSLPAGMHIMYFTLPLLMALQSCVTVVMHAVSALKLQGASFHTGVANVFNSVAGMNCKSGCASLPGFASHNHTICCIEGGCQRVQRAAGSLRPTTNCRSL